MCYSGQCPFEDRNGECQKPRHEKCWVEIDETVCPVEVYTLPIESHDDGI